MEKCYAIIILVCIGISVLLASIVVSICKDKKEEEQVPQNNPIDNFNRNIQRRIEMNKLKELSSAYAQENELRKLRQKVEELTNQPKLTRCPNCGAILNDNKCEYCGTKF